MTLSTVATVRLQRSRAKGSRLVSPNGLPVVCVSRPGRWGNHYKVINPAISEARYAVVDIRHGGIVSRFGFQEHAIECSIKRFSCELYLGLLSFGVIDIRRELAGKNLACWCKLGSPCHADVLLRVAAGGEP